MPILAKLQRFATEDARQFAYRILKLSILELLLRPGEKLNEVELANSASMSRTPMHNVMGKLGRENLVEQIPQRGAFVTRIHADRAEQAAWAQSQSGTSVLELLYTLRISSEDFEPLRRNLSQQQYCVATEDYDGAVRHVFKFYKLLYELANLDTVWDSLQYAGADLYRLFHLIASQPENCETALLECRAVLEALEKRDNATACRALQHFYTRLCEQIPLAAEKYPDYFELV